MSEIDPYEFERRVADLYRSLGADVAHNVSLAGSQIDVVAKEVSPGGTTLTRIVECKAYSRPVGSPQVRSFAALSQLLRDRQLVSVSTLVSLNGFTAEARHAAEAFGIELLEIADLEARVKAVSHVPITPGAPQKEHEGEKPEGGQSGTPRAFVAIPFSPRYDDVYLLGIRGAAEDAGISVERADENLDSTEIIEYIKSRIGAADFLIADTSELNPNVFYELGFADGMGKRVLLIAAADTELPFDVRGRSHILYRTIHELRTHLGDRFIQLLEGT